MKQKTYLKNEAYRFKRFINKPYSAFNSMHKVVNIGVVALLTLTFAHSSEVSAQNTVNNESAKITEKELDEVTVTASRIELPMAQTTKQVIVVTQKEIQQAPVQNVQDLLNYLAEVDVQQRGTHGVQADISIRGGSFDQTAILLNGVNISNPQTGHLSFNPPINLSDIERIEVILGPASTIYGANALSGGINIITKKDPDHKVYGKVQAGGHELFNAELNGVVKAGASTNQLSVGYSTSDGYRPNSDYDIFNALWQTQVKVEKSKVDIQLGYNNKKYGANTFYSPKYPNQYEKTESYLASIKGETGDKLKFIPTVYWNRNNDCFQLIRGDASKIPFNYHRTDVYGSNLSLQYTSFLGITSLGAEFRNEGVVSSVLGKQMDHPDGKYTHSDERTSISYALEHTVEINKFNLSAGILTNYNTGIKGDYKFYPSFSASYRITNPLKVYGTWSKAMRMPTFTDLYYNTTTHEGNTDLKPEKSEAFELGFKYTSPLVRAYATGYLMYGKDLIDWMKDDSNPKWQSHNITKVDKQGIELGAKFYLQELIKSLDPNTTLQLGYTRLHQSGDNISEETISNYTLNYLRDKFTAQFNHPIYKNISASWNFRWQKRMGSYLKYENITATKKEPYPTFSTLDVQLNWDVKKDLKLFMNINNLYNTYYFDLGNIPQSGFWMMGGISYAIR